MKTLRYLLIVIAAMAVLSVSAQSLAQEPQIGFQSTSSMVGSGSTLPQAAQTGAYTTYDQGYNAGRANKAGIRRFGENEGFEEEGDEPESGLPSEPFPIGDGVWVLMVLAAVYSIVAIYRKRAMSK